MTIKRITKIHPKEEFRWELNSLDITKTKRLENIFIMSKEENEAIKRQREEYKERKEEEKHQRWLNSI
jgi:hypothetical protein